MSVFLPSLPEKFSSALQPETLLDLLQIEGMKIEEESEVKGGRRGALLPWVGSGPGAGALWRERWMSAKLGRGELADGRGG